MAKTDPTESPPVRALRKFAMRFPDAEEGTSCVNRAFRAGRKAYLYLGMKKDTYSVMVKLGDSQDAAQALHAKRPDNYRPGTHGWTKVVLPHDEFPAAQLEAWIEESYRLLVPKSLVEALPAKGLAARARKKATAKKKPTAKKASARKKPAAKKTKKKVR